MATPSSGFMAVLSAPFTWAAAGIVVSLEWAFQRWFHPPLGLFFASAALGVVLLGGWIVWLSRSEIFAQRRIQQAQDQQRGRLHRLEQLSSDLESVGSEQGVRQLASLQHRFETLTEVLKRRLDSGELTYLRYLGTAEQVFLSALDNLDDISVSLRSISSIDRPHLERRLIEINNNQVVPISSKNEREALEKRKILLDSQLTKIEDLLAQNEKAMTALDQAAAVLANARMTRGRASIDIDIALHELDQLAGRTARYAAVRR